MTPLPFREAVLRAVTSTDSQSPFISPTQLADALNTFMQHLLDELGMRHRKEWAGKAELKRTFKVSDHTCRKVLENFSIPFKTTASGIRKYNVSRFEKALTQIV